MKKQIGCVAVLALVTGLGVSARAELIFGMTAAGSGSPEPGLGLVSFDSTTPGSITNIGAFTGVVAGQSVRSMDFRPATGQLYAVSSTDNGSAAQLYTVDLATAALTPVGTGFSIAGQTTERVEIDFNPVVDRIRLITGNQGANNNYRLHPDTGALVAQDTALAFAAGDPKDGNSYTIIGGAYSNNVSGATSTTLYVWEYQSDALITLGSPGGSPVSPNSGQMFTVHSPLSALTSQAGLGMDISGATNTLFVTHDNVSNPSGTFMSLYSRDLTTGAEIKLGDYAPGVFISDISVPTNINAAPEPSSLVLGLLGAGGLATYLRRRKKG